MTSSTTQVHFFNNSIALALILLISWNTSCHGFLTRPPTPSLVSTIRRAEIISPSCLFEGRPSSPNKGDDDKVEVGSKEYLEGFISSPIQDDSVPERGTGLEQAIKLSAGVAVVLLALFLGFMASNGLL